jgi:uncharacterized membrane protein YqhA
LWAGQSAFWQVVLQQATVLQRLQFLSDASDIVVVVLSLVDVML